MHRAGGPKALQKVGDEEQGQGQGQRQQSGAGTESATGSATRDAKVEVQSIRAAFMISSVLFIWVRVDSWWANRGQGHAGHGPVAARPLTTVVSTSLGGCMNNTEETMSNSLPRNPLIAHSKALEAAGMSIALVTRVPAPLKSIADQVIRSASSVPANLSEGHGRTGRDRFHHWRIAYASAKEVDTHLRLLAQAGAIDKNRTNAALNLFDQVRAMTWRLLNPRG